MVVVDWLRPCSAIVLIRRMTHQNFSLTQLKKYCERHLLTDKPAMAHRKIVLVVVESATAEIDSRFLSVLAA